MSPVLFSRCVVDSSFFLSFSHSHSPKVYTLVPPPPLSFASTIDELYRFFFPPVDSITQTKSIVFLNDNNYLDVFEHQQMTRDFIYFNRWKCKQNIWFSTRAHRIKCRRTHCDQAIQATHLCGMLPTTFFTAVLNRIYAVRCLSRNRLAVLFFFMFCSFRV